MSHAPGTFSRYGEDGLHQIDGPDLTKSEVTTGMSDGS
jgi:hypothetical protein